MKHNQTVQPFRENMPIPHSPSEASLLLATARMDYGIRVAQKDLADKLVERDMLQLQYNQLQVEQARQNLVAAEYHVGRVRLVMRKSGYYAACLNLNSTPRGFHPYGK